MGSTAGKSVTYEKQHEEIIQETEANKWYGVCYTDCDVEVKKKKRDTNCNDKKEMKYLLSTKFLVVGLGADSTAKHLRNVQAGGSNLFKHKNLYKQLNKRAHTYIKSMHRKKHAHTDKRVYNKCFVLCT